MGSNAFMPTESHRTGGRAGDGAVPITGATAKIHMPIFSYYHTLNCFGRTANITFIVPYGVGDFNGTVLEAPRHAYRSGLLDSYTRFSVNLKGGPAMNLQQFS